MPSLMSSLDQAVVWRRPSGRKGDNAVVVVKSLLFEARIRGRPALRENRTWCELGSKTKAPLLPMRRKSFPNPAASLERETAAWAAAAPCAIGVRNALSGP